MWTKVAAAIRWEVKRQKQILKGKFALYNFFGPGFYSISIYFLTLFFAVCDAHIVLSLLRHFPPISIDNTIGSNLELLNDAPSLSLLIGLCMKLHLERDSQKASSNCWKFLIGYLSTSFEGCIIKTPWIKWKILAILLSIFIISEKNYLF